MLNLTQIYLSTEVKTVLCLDKTPFHSIAFVVCNDAIYQATNEELSFIVHAWTYYYRNKRGRMIE